MTTPIDLTAEGLRRVATFLDRLDGAHAQGLALAGDAPDVYLDDRYVGTLHRAYPDGEGDDETVWAYCLRIDAT